MLVQPNHEARWRAHSWVVNGHGHLPQRMLATGHAVQAAGVLSPGLGTGELPGKDVPPVRPLPSSRQSLAAIPSIVVRAYSLRC